jgi:hypothetical protein
VANLPPVSLTPAANLPPVSAAQGELVEKFATGVVDTGGNPLTCEYLCKFSKKFEMTLLLFSGAWGKMIHEKNLKQKFCDTVPLII